RRAPCRVHSLACARRWIGVVAVVAGRLRERRDSRHDLECGRPVVGLAHREMANTSNEASLVTRGNHLTLIDATIRFASTTVAPRETPTRTIPLRASARRGPPHGQARWTPDSPGRHAGSALSVRLPAVQTQVRAPRAVGAALPALPVIGGPAHPAGPIGGAGCDAPLASWAMFHYRHTRSHPVAPPWTSSLSLTCRAPSSSMK